MKKTVSPRTVAFLILALLTPVAFAKQERQPKSRIHHAPVAEYYLPSPAKSLIHDRGTSSEARGAETRVFRNRPVERKVSSHQLNRYEVDPQSFTKGLSAVSAAQREIAGR